MSWGKRIAVGLCAAYLAWSVGRTGVQGKRFDYLLDILGNKDGRVESSELTYLEKRLISSAESPAEEYLCYDLEKSDTKVLYDHPFTNTDDILFVYGDKRLTVRDYAPHRFLDEAVKEKNERSPSKEEPCPQAFGIVKLVFDSNYFVDREHLLKHFRGFEYFVYDAGRIRQESAGEKLKRYARTAVN